MTKQLTKEYYSYFSESRKKTLMVEKDIKTRTIFLIKENLKHIFVLDNVDATVGLSLMNVTIFLLGGLTNNTINVCISTYLQGMIFILSLLCYIIQTNFQKSIISDIFFVILLFVSCIFPFLSIKLNGGFNKLGLILKILILVMAINVNEINIYIILLLLSCFFFISISFSTPKNLMMMFPYINEYQEICLLKLADIIIDINNYMDVKLNIFCHDIPQINLTKEKNNFENLQMNISRIINKFYTLKNQKIFLNFPPYYCLKALYYKKLNLMTLYIEKKKKKIKKKYSNSQLSKKMNNSFIYYDIPYNHSPPHLPLKNGDTKECDPVVKSGKEKEDIIRNDKKKDIIINYKKKDIIINDKTKDIIINDKTKDMIINEKKEDIIRKDIPKDRVRKDIPKDRVRKDIPKDRVRNVKAKGDVRKENTSNEVNKNNTKSKSRKKEIKIIRDKFRNSFFYSKICSKQIEDNPPKKIIIDHVKKNKIEKKAEINNLFTSTIGDDSEAKLKVVNKKERKSKRDDTKRDDKKRDDKKRDDKKRDDKKRDDKKRDDKKRDDIKRDDKKEERERERERKRKRKHNSKKYESTLESSATENLTIIKPHVVNKNKITKIIEKSNLISTEKYRDTKDEQIKNKLNKIRKKKKEERSKNHTNQEIQIELDITYKNLNHNNTKKHKNNNKKKFIEQKKHGHEIYTNVSNQELYKKSNIEKNNVLDKSEDSIYDKYITNYNDKANYKILPKFPKSLEQKEKRIKYNFKKNNNNISKCNELKENDFIEINKNHKKKTNLKEKKTYSFYSNEDQYISDEKIIFINLSCLFYVLIHKIKQLLKYIEKINLVVQSVDFKQGISPKQNFLLSFIDQKAERYYILWSNMFDLIYHIENFIIHILLILVFTFSTIFIRIAPIHLSRSYVLFKIPSFIICFILRFFVSPIIAILIFMPIVRIKSVNPKNGFIVKIIFFILGIYM
ncbi:hypothetical protein YYC_04171 [Plasmodium yoelii 17X]|uniref:Uncharacterized protein n=1 Tax=Plasmodium yoelii 17X TaxID=1323249 RepID=V7PEY1_PLAYE|nr:hypothetical protein YYC_04171 [Plasmodium yoelii 17X]